MICKQNNYLRNFRVIPVFELLPSALAHEIAVTNQDKAVTVQTVERFIITSQPCINGMEITNPANDLWKVFFKSNSANIIQARDYVDRVLKGLYGSDSMPATMILPNFNPPGRGDAPRAASTALSLYATALANLGNPQEENHISSNNAPPPRPNRRNLSVMYNLAGDFPNLP